MTRNPRLEINLAKLTDNARTVVGRAAAQGVEIVGVTKVCCGAPEVAMALKKGGVAMLGDSRVENIARMREAGVPGPFVLIRLPMLSQADDVVRQADYSLVSDVTTVRALGQAAARAGRKHGVIVMVDVGDLREGFWPDQVPVAVDEILTVDGVELAGLGVNLTCYGAICPSPANLGILTGLAADLQSRHSLKLPIVSGGNSSSLGMLWNGTMPGGITQLRIGEGIMLGCETLERECLQGLHHDAFVAVAEAVEVRRKPSVPIGEVAQDVFGNVPAFEDRGVHQRVILALGRQDAMFDSLVPCDEGVLILGGSSDHTILEVSGREAHIGDEFRFTPGYGALLALNTSPYVQKLFLS